MKHKCINWLDNNGICQKCYKPEWADYFENPFRIGDKVKIPIHYTDGGQTLKIVKMLRDGSYRLEDDTGSCIPIESYEWWELRPTKKLRFMRRQGVKKG
jgi:hypothetical protein